MYSKYITENLLSERLRFMWRQYSGIWCRQLFLPLAKFNEFIHASRYIRQFPYKYKQFRRSHSQKFSGELVVYFYNGIFLILQLTNCWIYRNMDVWLKALLYSFHYFIWTSLAEVTRTQLSIFSRHGKIQVRGTTFGSFSHECPMTWQESTQNINKLLASDKRTLRISSNNNSKKIYVSTITKATDAQYCFTGRKRVIHCACHAVEQTSSVISDEVWRK